MKWSWKMGKLAGIDLRVHATFSLLILWIAASYWMVGKNTAAVLAAVGFVIALFGCVVLHELGHALMARQFGIQTTDITLLPIGGLARLERMPEEPRQELWIALAGPAVNVAIAVLLYSWLSVTHVWEPFSRLRVATGPFLERLMVANVSLVLFNLIPAFPLDGGRALRALLATRMNYLDATQVAASVGQVLAFALGVVGIFTNPMLAVIGLFVWMAARQEAGATQMKSAISGLRARAVMRTDFWALHSTDTLADAVQLTLKRSQSDFPVIDRGEIAGMLTRGDLLAALAEFSDDRAVASVMRRDFPTADSADPLEVVFRRLQECDCDSIPVVQGGTLVGLISTAQLREHVLLTTLLRKRGRRSGIEDRAA
jgi:Zn-dependent protease/predicted transcriptional regulator